MLTYNKNILLKTDHSYVHWTATIMGDSNSKMTVMSAFFKFLVNGLNT